MSASVCVLIVAFVRASVSVATSRSIVDDFQSDVAVSRVASFHNVGSLFGTHSAVEIIVPRAPRHIFVP